MSKDNIKALVEQELNSILSEQSDSRMRVLDQFRTETGITSTELLEDVLEQLDDQTFSAVLKGLRNKYGYL